MSELIKQDINFLEYPMYVLTEKAIKENISVKIGDKEYTMLVGYKTPNSTDILYLYYFIKILQKNDYPEIITIKQSSLIKDLFDGSDSSYYYKKIKDCLKVWKNVGISFNGSFYDGKNYKAIEFAILDVGQVDEDGVITIEFNRIFLSILKNTNFYRYINLNEFKELKRPISRRLYELLKKSSFPYKIEIAKLADKMLLKRKFASQIIQKLKPAVNEINKNTDLKINFNCSKNEDGENICIFEKHKEHKNLLTCNENTNNNIPENIISLIPENKKTKNVLELIKFYVDNNFEKEYIEYNIKYSLINSSKNFYLYLSQALQHDYSKDFREFDILKKKEKEKQNQILASNKLKEEEQLKFEQDCKNFIALLSEEEYKKYSVSAKKELVKEWNDAGHINININSKIPSPCVNEKIYKLYGLKATEKNIDE